MKTRTLLYSLLIFLLTACSAPPETSPAAPAPSRTAASTPTRTPRSSPTLYPTWTPRPTLPTRTPVATSTLPPPTTTLLPVIWGELGQPLWLENTSLRWSPTANEAITFRYIGVEMDEIGLAAPPDFQVKRIFFHDSRFTGGFLTWSPDGEWFLFGGPTEDMDQQFMYLDELSVLWAADRTGGRLHQVLPGSGLARWLTIEGWMDSATLVTSDYMGGGHKAVEIVDFLKGEVLARVGFHGPVFEPNTHYVPAAEEYAYPYRLFAITRTRQPGTLQTGMMNEETHYARAYPCDDSSCNSWVFFKDWLPGADRMLVQVYTYDFPTNAFLTSELRLWDLDTDRTQQVAAGAIDGSFSPDGKTLAFVTLGPLPLDGSGKQLSASLEVSPNQPPYLHLMDFASRQVFLSLPIESSYDTLGYITWIFNLTLSFSLDSRYMAFYTSGAVQTDARGEPIDVIGESEETSYLNILDLHTRKLLVSSRRAEDTWGFEDSYWSPNGNAFVYQDQDANWLLFDLRTGESQSLTLGDGEQLFSPGWSSDGQYLDLNIFHQDEYRSIWLSSTAIFHLPGAAP